MKIYTRTGDQGTTSLFAGHRVGKDHPTIDALGAVDEANSTLGLALSTLPSSLLQTRQQLESIQHGLFDIGAAIATPRTSGEAKKLEKTHFDHEAIDRLEKWIDAMEITLPPLKTFILPGGHPSGAALHLSRALARRAERAVIPLYQQKEVTEEVLRYLNRLSDYLFVTARYVNHLLNIPETQWSPHKA